MSGTYTWGIDGSWDRQVNDETDLDCEWGASMA